MRVSLLTLIIISAASVQISFATEHLDSKKENEDFLPSIFRQEEKYPDLYKTLSDEKQANLNPPIHTNQSLGKSFSEKFQQVTQYMYDLWQDPLGFGDLLKDIDLS
jgi:hypothetical protein